ncbi:MAG: ABC transporter ATP-binding protein [Crocinitomicaceae bacterium]|nr:ABC transporter ATP-binding protein [Crocinitomicaceae bacterium]|tara:strand:+ start:1800 stop:2426 length:627 start_codon:yes stop_codon:yes gene_type:complete
MILSASGLSISYPLKTIEFPDLRIKKGEHHLIIGESGSGKTSLLNILGGILQPKTGNVLISETDIFSLKKSSLDSFRGNNLGFIFQTPHFIKSLNVLDNLLMSQFCAGLKNKKNDAISLMEKVGLNNKLNAKISELSEGEKQRVSIVRGLLNAPKIILADEPTSALDDSSCNNVIDLMTNLANEVDATLLIVTHDKRLKDRFERRVEI